MKKLLILAVILMSVLTSCSNLDNVSPNSTSSNSSSNTGMSMSLSLVAQSARDYVTSNYVGYSITEAEKQTEDTGIQYKLTIEKGSSKKRLLFDANWKFLREKN